MTKKKPTTNTELAAQIADMTELVKNIEPGHIVQVDRQLQERNTTLMLMLYGAAAKYGVGLAGAPNGIVVTAQLPVLQVPANHQLAWEVSEDGKSVMLYIVLTDSPEEESIVNAPVIESEESSMPAETTDGSVFPALAEIDDSNATINRGVADEYEDEVKVGLDD